MGCKYVPEELKKAARKELGAASEKDIVQADFTQNDATDLSYIKNRPFYEVITKESIEGLEYTINTIGKGDSVIHGLDIPLELGQVWKGKSEHDGSWYEYEVQRASAGFLYIGDPNLNSAPWCITNDKCAGNTSWIGQMKPRSITLIGVSGTRTLSMIKTLEPKYLPVFDFTLDLTCSGSIAFADYDQVKEAYTNNMSITVVSTQTTSAGVLTYSMTWPFIKDLTTVNISCGLVYIQQQLEVSKGTLSIYFDIDEYEKGNIVVTSARITDFSASRTVVKVYASPF